MRQHAAEEPHGCVDPGHVYEYALPELEMDRFVPFDQLRRVLGEWVGEVAVSANLVMLRTPPGCAHVVASALDSSGLDGLLGTVAGDDTLLVISRDAEGGAALARRFLALANHDTTSLHPAKDDT